LPGGVVTEDIASPHIHTITKPVETRLSGYHLTANSIIQISVQTVAKRRQIVFDLDCKAEEISGKLQQGALIDYPLSELSSVPVDLDN